MFPIRERTYPNREAVIIDFVNPIRAGTAHFMVSVDGIVYRRPMPPTKENLDLARHLANELMKWIIFQTGGTET